MIAHELWELIFKLEGLVEVSKTKSCPKITSYSMYYFIYLIAGMFGGGKVWRIWRVVRGLSKPKFTI